jgi:ribosomal protein S18 acetylase RimI-like enzyme
MLSIRAAGPEDADALWALFQTVVLPGDTFAFAPETSRDEALAAWLSPAVHTHVALDGAQVAGASLLKPNQPGLGAHVANAAFMVAPWARGRGVGRALGEHVLAEARRLGYRAMQFNLVVATNQPAVALWTKLGFRIVGTLPGAFRHRTLGFVDAHVMYREL